MPPNNSNGTGPDDIPTAAFFGQQRAWLAQNGFSQQQINEAIGLTPNGRTNAQINGHLNEWLRGNV